MFFKRCFWGVGAQCALVGLGFLVAENAVSRPVWAQPFPEREPLSGVILDSDGAPVAGALVSVRRQNDIGNFAFWGAETRSDAQGKWRFEDGELGAYYLNVEAPGYASQINSSLDWKRGAAPFEVRLRRLVSLKLRLFLPDGTRAANRSWMLRMRSLNDTVFRRLRTDANGEFWLRDIVPATYSFSLTGEDGYAIFPEFEIGATPKGAAQNNNEREITLQKGADLRLKVTDERGRPLGGARFSVVLASPEETQRLLGTTEISVDFASPSVESNGEGAPAPDDSLDVLTQDGQGGATISNLPPANYRVRLLMAGVNLGGDGEQTIDLSQTSGELSWRVAVPRAATLTLDAKTPDDKPLAGARLALRFLWLGSGTPETENEALAFLSAAGARRVQLDGAGRAAIFPVRAGRYRVFAAVQNADGSFGREFGPFETTIPSPKNGGEATGNVTIFIPEPQKLAR